MAHRMEQGSPEMAKYYGFNYSAKERTGSPLDKTALDKSYHDDHPERDTLLQAIIDRLNLLLANVSEINAREAHDSTYTDTSSTKTSIGDAIDALTARIVTIEDIVASVEFNTTALINPDGEYLCNPDGEMLVA